MKGRILAGWAQKSPEPWCGHLAVIIVWKVASQHLFLNIIPNNLWAKTGGKVWCAGAWGNMQGSKDSQKATAMHYKFTNASKQLLHIFCNLI